MTATSTPELLYLLHGDPAEMAEALRGLRGADIAEALRALPPAAAAKVLAALPLDAAVQVFDEPEFEHERCSIIQQLDAATAGPLIEAMSADQRADLFRELPEEERRRFLGTLSDSTRAEMQLLLEYSPRTAGGIMTTEFVGVPADWTVEQVIEHIRKVGRAKETGYAIYVLDAADRRLLGLAADFRIAVIVNRPFAEGALFRRFAGRPLPGWAAEFGCASWAQFFLKWILAHPAVTCAIPGTRNVKHIDENLGAATGALPDAAMRRRMAAHIDRL